MAAPSRSIVDFRLDENELAAIQARLGTAARSAGKVILRSLNDAGKRMDTHLRRQLSKLTRISQKRIKRRVKLSKASRSRLGVELSAWDAHIPLAWLSPRQNKKGASAAIPGKGRDTIEHAFVVDDTMAHFKGKHVMIRREGGLTESGLVPRMPIHAVYSDVTIADLAERFADDTLALGRRVYSERVGANIELILSGKRGG